MPAVSNGREVSSGSAVKVFETVVQTVGFVSEGNRRLLLRLCVK
jgi:hypothetical protein